MKKLLIALSVLSLAFVGCSKKDTDTAVDKTKDAANTAVEKTKEVATDAKNAISDKLTEWKLTPSDIKADLQKGATIVRTKTVAAGEKVASVAAAFSPDFSSSPLSLGMQLSPSKCTVLFTTLLR